MEEQVGTGLVDRQVADLIEDQDLGPDVFFEFAFEAAGALSGAERVDYIDGGGKKNRVALQAGRVSQGGGQMAFAQPDAAQEDDVGPLGDKLQTEEVLDLEAVDLLGPAPVELVQGFDDREAGLSDASLDRAVATEAGLAVGKFFQVADVVAGFSSAWAARPW